MSLATVRLFGCRPLLVGPALLLGSGPTTTSHESQARRAQQGPAKTSPLITHFGLHDRLFPPFVHGPVQLPQHSYLFK